MKFSLNKCDVALRNKPFSVCWRTPALLFAFVVLLLLFKVKNKNNSTKSPIPIGDITTFIVRGKEKERITEEIVKEISFEMLFLNLCAGLDLSLF